MTIPTDHVCELYGWQITNNAILGSDNLITRNSMDGIYTDYQQVVRV